LVSGGGKPARSTGRAIEVSKAFLLHRGVLLYIPLSRLSLPIYALTVAAFTCAAIYFAGEAEVIFGQKDPRRVVIDEIAGMLVTMLGIGLTHQALIAGFVLFRIFDITKPYPANLIDRKMKGGAGIVLDDVVAGIYANLALRAVMALGLIP
jgi:phosphatidylglycerophosphatase A